MLASNGVWRLATVTVGTAVWYGHCISRWKSLSARLSSGVSNRPLSYYSSLLSVFNDTSVTVAVNLHNHDSHKHCTST